MNVRLLDAQNYCLGKYIAIAINDPEKYPDKPFLAKEEEKTEEQQNEEFVSAMKAITVALGGTIYDGKNDNN